MDVGNFDEVFSLLDTSIGVVDVPLIRVRESLVEKISVIFSVEVEVALCKSAGSCVSADFGGILFSMAASPFKCDGCCCADDLPIASAVAAPAELAAAGV